MFLKLSPLIFVCIYVYSNVINFRQFGEKDMKNPGFLIETFYRNGVLLCARMCERITRCTSINFNPSLLVCEILQDRGFPSNAAVGWLYYHNTSWLQEVGQSNKMVDGTCRRNEMSTELSNGRTNCVKYGLPIDCQDIKTSNAAANSSSYVIFPNAAKPMEVYCDMDTDGGGWTVFQSRQDGSVDFFRTWNDYKTGFGDVSGEFWLGNDNLHQLLSSHSHILRIDMEDFEGNRRYATYSTFFVSDENDLYKVTIGGYIGNAGDSAGWMNGMNFSTKDADHDLRGDSCSMMYKGGWWYKECLQANLNGLYHHQSAAKFRVGVVWQLWKGPRYSLKTVTMKVKRN